MQLNGIKTLISHPCTRLNYPKFWCPVNNSIPRKIYEQNSFEWGECSLSCMEIRDENSVILTMNLSREMIKHFNFAEEIEKSVTYKGSISDVYIWDR